jgi:cytochrome c oxidase subunit 4
MSHAPHAVEEEHPTPKKYVEIGAILAIITTIEVAIFYVEALRPILIPVFLILSAVKFVLVAMFYMHLKFDSRLFTGAFVFGLLIAASIMIALMALMNGLVF